MNSRERIAALEVVRYIAVRRIRCVRTARVRVFAVPSCSQLAVNLRLAVSERSDSAASSAPHKAKDSHALGFPASGTGHDSKSHQLSKGIEMLWTVLLIVVIVLVVLALVGRGRFSR